MFIDSVHNPQIKTTHNQIITDHRIPMTKYDSVIENWNLFGIWDLDIGI
jgi:hypothetical protein